MKRRDFIANTAVSFIGLHLLSSFEALTGSNSIANTADDFSLNEATIDALQARMKSGKTSSEAITRLYLQRIAAIDQKGPQLRSVIEINPDAMALAKAADAERKKGVIRSALHGIPVLIKDNIDTGDNMKTTAGSLALQNHRAPKDAFIAKKLRDAGAVILGKTNLSEWANFRSTRSASGWSSRGGQTKNPYVLDRSPCGSSSGSGVAVAANLCAVAVGTETNGSISCPASMNNTVGIKPTVGLVSRSGIIPISKTQDTAGPLARTVKDAAILLGVLAGADPEDVVTTEKKERIQDYTLFLDSNGLTGKRIGVEQSFLKGHEAITALFRKAMDQMQSKGAEVIEVDFMKPFNAIGLKRLLVLQYEFKDGLNQYLAAANAPVRSLEDLIRYNKEHQKEVMPYFKQELFEQSQQKGSLEDKDYVDAMTKHVAAKNFYTQFFKDNNLDALCGPANGFPWCIDWMNGDSFTGYGMYSPAAICGFPSLTIPMGRVEELPVGLSFLGTAYSEPELITIGYAYEQASKNRTAPKFKASFGSEA